MTQGKCATCRVRYMWTGRLRLRDAYCPKCDHPLMRTTRALKWPVYGIASSMLVKRRVA